MELNYLFEWLNLKNYWILNNIYFKVFLILFLVLVVIFLVKFIFNLISFKITSRTKTDLDDKILQLLKKPVFYSVISWGLVLILMTIGFDEKSLLSKIIISTILIIWAIFVVKISKAVLNYLAFSFNGQSVVRPQTLPLFDNLSLILVCTIYFYLILAAWGVDINALIASAGVLGLAVGFAAKDTLANLFSGIFILIDQPYKMNDFVVLDTGDRGCVTHIGIRSTRILTRDDVEVTIPNAIMGNTKIINESGGPHKKYRIRVPIGVAYGTETAVVREILLKVANANKRVCQSPEPRVRFRAFGASSLDMDLLCWIADPVLRGKVLDGLHENIYTEFLTHKIEIPYQKQDVYIKETPSTLKNQNE